MGHPLLEKIMLIELLNSAQNGDANAAYEMGLLEYIGLDCGNLRKNDINEAIHWFEIAHNGEINDASAQLGSIYMYEDGYIDYDKAISYLTIAANNGHLYSIYTLGVCYTVDTRGMMNLEQARYWFELGSMKGCTLSTYMLTTEKFKNTVDTEI